MTFPVFASGDVLNASDMNAVGLWLVNSTSFTATDTINFDNVFTSNYRNYRIVWDFTSDANGQTEVRMRVGGVTTSGGTDYAWSRFFKTTTTAPADNGGSNAQAYGVFTSTSTADSGQAGAWDVFRPQLAARTIWNGVSTYTTLFEGGYIRHNLATSYDGFAVTAGGNKTGVIRVYGYRD